MKNLIFWLAIIAVIIFALKNHFSEQDRLIDEEDASAQLYALNAIDNSWPRILESAGPLAQNILASNYYIVLDGSGSMGESNCSEGNTKLEVAKKALTAFVQQLPQDANVGLFIFDGYGRSERVSMGSGQPDQFTAQVNAAYASGGTPLRSALEHGYAALHQQAQRQLGYGEYHLVVVTDGEASGDHDPRPVVRHILAESPVVIHTIGFCIGEDHSLNQPGRTYYRAANDPQSLHKSLDAVLAEAPDFNVDQFSAD